MMTVLLTICLLDKGLCWGNDDENNKTYEIVAIQEAKSKDGSANDELLLLASQMSEENQVC